MENAKKRKKEEGPPFFQPPCFPKSRFPIGCVLKCHFLVGLTRPPNLKLVSVVKARYNVELLIKIVCFYDGVLHKTSTTRMILEETYCHRESWSPQSSTIRYATSRYKFAYLEGIWANDDIH